MRPFRFARIKRIREVEEKLAEEAFAEAAAHLRHIAKKAREYTGKYREYRIKFQKGEISWLEMVNVVKAISLIHKELEEAYRQLQEKKKELLDANVRLKMMERLEELWREEMFMEEMQNLQEILDDFAAYKDFEKHS